jgi:hypothetical protein
MKTVVGRFVALAVGLLTIGVLPGRTQIMNQLDFTVSQPFTVANTTLPAGSYIIRSVTGTELQVLEIASANGHPAVMVDVNSAQPDAGQGGCHLVFNKYKNVLALSEVFPGGGNTGYQLVQGHPEQLASKTEKPTKQTVPSTAK